MKVVILCGGRGTRLREKTEYIPKPLVEIGGKPILWHIMKYYSFWGFNDFILCLGYLGNEIKEYFMKHEEWEDSDFTLRLSSEGREVETHSKSSDNWNITFADTGLDTNTGGRIRKIEKYVKEPHLFVTYGDGLSNINLIELLNYHKKHGIIATITCVRPISQFGIVDINSEEIITRYREKPRMVQWVSGGFFVFNKEIFSYLGENDILEREPFEQLAKESNMCAYKFEGFWKCMDTYKDTQMLEELWNAGRAPWKVWE